MSMLLKRILSLGITPCPNDSFMFQSLVAGGVDLAPYGLTVTTAGVERLNLLCSSGELDVAKVSARALPTVLDDYVMLRAGASMARGLGPIVVASRELDLHELPHRKLAIPGRSSTANFLLELHGGHKGPRVEMRYGEIMAAVQEGRVEAGLLTHEGRFTYKQHGLHIALDLGRWWEEKTDLPLCLGGVVAKRSLGMETILQLEEAVRQSIDMARKDPSKAAPFVKRHAGSMDMSLQDTYIEAYVNEYSRDIGEEGENGLLVLLHETYSRQGRQFPKAGILTPPGDW